MTELKLSEAKAHLGKYVKEVAKGRSYVITSHNLPIAELRSLASESSKGICPELGLLRGKITIPEDFDAELSEFENDFYGQ